MKTDRVSINGVDLAYARRGTGASLLLIHGFPLDRTCWNELALLLEDEFDLILPDLRGFGQSGTVESIYSMADIASDLAGLLDHLKIEQAFVAGHSMGGYVALAFAHAHPDRVRGLALVSSQALPDAPERKQGRYKTAADVAEQGVRVVVEVMTSKLSSDPRVQAFVHEAMERQPASGMIGALKAMAERADATSWLPDFKFPLVIVHGEADALIPVARGRDMKTALPSAHYVELKGLGHMPMMENAQAVAEALLRLKRWGS